MKSDDLLEVIKELKAKLVEKERENAQLKHTLFEYGIEEGVEMSDEYFICVNEIRKLKELSECQGELSDKEVKAFETLNKSLHLIKGNIDQKAPKMKEVSKDELLKIVDGGNKDG